VIAILHYVTEKGRDLFDEWMQKQAAHVRTRVLARIDRIEFGNFGDWKSVGEGVSELRIDVGPGYRVYFGRDGKKIVILLGGGTKRRQVQDIENAKKCWKMYKQEKRRADERT